MVSLRFRGNLASPPDSVIVAVSTRNSPGSAAPLAHGVRSLSAPRDFDRRRLLGKQNCVDRRFAVKVQNRK